MIPEPLYRDILRAVPIVCVDLAVRRADGQFLLVRRKNEPLKGEWWVIGGRILHGEKAANAVVRKLAEETGLSPLAPPKFLGMYEDLFDRNAFEPSPYHTFSLVYEVMVGNGTVALDAQSDGFQWDTRLPARFVVQPSESLRDYLRNCTNA